MKLVTKLSAALIAGMVLVLALNGYFRVQREVALLRSDRVHDHALIGGALAAAVGAAWRLDGRDQALRLIAAANERDGAVKARWVDASESANVPALNDVPSGETSTTLSGSQRRSYTAVSVGADRAGFIELSEKLDVEERTARTIVFDTFVTTITLILVSGALAGLLGVWLVGRPVQALSAKARRLGEGDFSEPLVLRQRDELGVLAHEMNATCTRLTEAAERVDREVAARVAALEQLRHVDRLTTVGKLASGVAHELGTPLNVVGARAKMIAVGRTGPAETKEYAQVIADAADRMAQIIRQMLTFARRKATAKALRDLRKITVETTELLRPMAAKANVVFRLEAPDAPPVMAEVDAGAIQQVVTNILVNAIQAMPDGGEIDVNLESEARRAMDEHPGRYVVIRIRDAGTGISEEDRARIFEPFFTTKEVGRGTGLGLSVTHGIVEDHGGFIEVTSELGKGSTFAIHLPALSPPS